jgi:hypothetical protein
MDVQAVVVLVVGTVVVLLTPALLLSPDLVQRYRGMRARMRRR